MRLTGGMLLRRPPGAGIGHGLKRPHFVLTQHRYPARLRLAVRLLNQPFVLAQRAAGRAPGARPLPVPPHLLQDAPCRVRADLGQAILGTTQRPLQD